MKPITDWRAGYRTTGDTLAIPRGGTGWVEVEVTNRSRLTWSKTLGRFSVYLGYKITDPNTGRSVTGTNRGLLPSIVHPDQSVAVNLPVDAPLEPGDYILEISLVQADVGWFSDIGVAPITMKLPAR